MFIQFHVLYIIPSVVLILCLKFDIVSEVLLCTFKMCRCLLLILIMEESSYIFELPHDKTNKMACAPSEDSDQPGLPPSLIRVFAVRMKKAWVLSYPLSAQ